MRLTHMSSHPTLYKGGSEGQDRRQKTELKFVAELRGLTFGIIALSVRVGSFRVNKLRSSGFRYRGGPIKNEEALYPVCLRQGKVSSSDLIPTTLELPASRPR